MSSQPFHTTVDSQSNYRRSFSQSDHGNNPRAGQSDHRDNHRAGQSDRRDSHKMSQSYHMDYLNQSDYRNKHRASQFDNWDFLSQSDDDDYSTESDDEGTLDSYDPLDSLLRGWTISRGTTRNIRHLLTSNPKYSSTIHRPPQGVSTQEGSTQGLSELFKNVEETNKSIKRFCQEGDIEKAIAFARAAIERYTMTKQEILMALEKCLILQGHELSQRNAMDAVDAFIKMGYKPRHLLNTLPEHGANNVKHSGTGGSNEDLDSEEIKEISADIRGLCKLGQTRKAIALACDTIKKDPVSRQDIFMPLEKVLTERVKKISLPDALYCLDAFIQMEFYQPRHFLPALLEHLAAHFESTEKTPANIAHLLYFIGLAREAPPKLMHCLELYVQDNISEYNTVDISLICFAYFVTNRVMRCSSLIKTMANTVLEELRDSLNKGSQNNVNLLGTILKAFKHAGYDDMGFYMELGDLLCDTDALSVESGPLTMIGHTILNIPPTYASARIKHSRLFQKIQQLVDQLWYHRGYRLRLAFIFILYRLQS